MAILYYRKKYNFGFSLIEICIACIVLAVILIPVFTLLSKGNAGTLHNRNEILAREYAANIIAFYNLKQYDEVKEPSADELNSMTLESEDKNFKIDLNDLGYNFEALRNLNLNTDVKIEEFNSDSWAYKYKFISVTVEWKESNKPNPSKITMTGMVTER